LIIGERETDRERERGGGTDRQTDREAISTNLCAEISTAATLGHCHARISGHAIWHTAEVTSDEIVYSVNG